MHPCLNSGFGLGFRLQQSVSYESWQVQDAITIVQNTYLACIYIYIYILMLFFSPCRAYGVALLYLYVVFMVFSVLTEVNVLPIRFSV